jgi:hypothetical protein
LLINFWYEYMCRRLVCWQRAGLRLERIVKYWIVMGFLLVTATHAFAESCDYTRPPTVDLPYQEGAYTPVYFSRYQFNLPSKPDVLLSADGIIASYPNRNYIGQQHVEPAPWIDQLNKFTSRPVSVVEFYRLIYGISSTENLNADELKEVQFQRSLLKLDCDAKVIIYHVGGTVDVVFQPMRAGTGFYTIMLLGDEGVELITLRLPMEEVMQVIASIKRRR